MRLRDVLQFIRSNGLIQPGERVLAACSGGPDSVALVHLLARLAPTVPFQLEVLHINHRRGPAGDEAEALCRETATRLALPFHRREIAPAPPPRANREEWMRQRRLEIFDEFRRSGFHRIALGHQRDDQAETFWLRLLRGAGSTGLGGMAPATTDGRIRPLLATSRSEILDYLRAHGLAWHEDATNRDGRHRRNRLRHRVLPVLAESGFADAAAVMARTADLLREEAAALDAAVERLLPPLAEAADGIRFALADFLALPEALQGPALRAVIRRARGDLRRLERQHVDRALRLLRAGRSGRRTVLPGGLEIRLGSGVVRLALGPARCAEFEYVLEVPGRLEVPEAGAVFEALDGSPPAGLSEPHIVVPRSDGPLCVRSVRPGDRIRLSGGTRKLKAVLQERRIPVFDRDRVVVVCAADGNILGMPELSLGLCYNDDGCLGVDRLITIVRRAE
mgnify:FL=1